MIYNLFDKKIAKVLTYFLISPGSRNIRKEIKEKTKLNNVQLDETLKLLLLLKIIKRDKKYYSLKFESEKYNEIIDIFQREYLQFNLPYKIFNLLCDILRSISNIGGIDDVILFGSYSKLIYSVKSDIDIAIILEDKLETRPDIESTIEKKMNKLEKKHNQVIEVHFFSKKDLKANDPLIKDIIKNGKSLIML